MNTKIIVATFFPVYPITFGSSVVISSFFENIENKNKVLFQISKKNIKKKNIKNILNQSDSKIFKFFSVLVLINNLLAEIKRSNYRNVLIMEGASWIGYSFILLVLVKLLFKNIKVIYKAHSIEYEIRKQNSNFIISNLSFIFEKFVYKNCDVSTSVSPLEQKKIKQLYNVKTELFPNIVELSKGNKNLSKLNKQYIFYSGSYDYLPNKNAIDRLINKIMPIILKKNPNLLLVLTGSKKIPYRYDWLKNLGMQSKDNYLNILKNSICLVVPTREGYGTRVKIIEALCNGVVVVSSRIGIEGIAYDHKSPPPFECNTDHSFVNSILKVLNNKNYKKRAKKNRSKYIKKYSAKLNTQIFVKNHS